MRPPAPRRPLTALALAVFLPAVRPVVAAIAVALVACSSQRAPAVRPPPPLAVGALDASATTPADAAPDLSIAAPASEADDTEHYPPPLAASWNDPAAIEALARDCDARSPSTVHGMGDGPDAMNCEEGITEQSCTYDPCHEDVDTPCRVECGATCSGCDARCRTSCRACRAACHDAECVRACAVSCGQCLEGCLDARDHCMTAGCTARYQACALRAARAFRRGPCLAACRRCTSACEARDDPHACVESCLNRQRGCTVPQANHCLWDGPSFGEAELAQARDAGVADAR